MLESSSFQLTPETDVRQVWICVMTSSWNLTFVSMAFESMPSALVTEL